MPYFRGVKPAEQCCEESCVCESVECMELPYLLRTRLEDLPLECGYLVLPEDVRAAAAKAMGERVRPRIGVVWAGGDWDRERWVPLHLLADLIGDRRFEWWSLQGGAAASEIRERLWPGAARSFRQRVRTVPRECGPQLIGVAAAISQLDLVLTVDTLAAHLAGAMGVSTWLMLKHHADWRWLKDRSDSPWYPSLRLFRQPAPGEWTSVIE